MWLSLLEKLNTYDRLQKRSPFMTQSPSWCILCKQADENLDHLLLHCEYSKKIWVKAIDLFNIIGAISKKWSEFVIVKWSFKGKRSMKRRMWRLALLAIGWQIWLERNKRIFEDKSRSVDDLWGVIKFHMGLWARASGVIDRSECFLLDLDCCSFFDSVS